MTSRPPNGRYSGRRRAIHGEISERGAGAELLGASIRQRFPSSRLLARLALGGLVAGGGFITSPVFAGAETVNVTDDDDLDIDTDDDLSDLPEDDITIDGDGDNTVDTNDGNDEVTIIGDGDNTVDGGDDDDEVAILGDGDNTVDGGDGNDDVDVVGNNGGGNNTVDGGDGDDTLDVNGGATNTVNGGDGNDEIEVGSSGGNTVDGGDGNDDVVAYNGDNIIDGGRGEDSVAGGIDSDTVDGGDGSDLVEGEPFDSLFSIKEDMGDDVISGGNGHDAAFGDTRTSAEFCIPVRPAEMNPERPRTEVECGDDSVSGDAGNDWVEGNLGSDDVTGGAGDDVVIGDDLLYHILGDAGVEGEQAFLDRILSDDLTESDRQEVIDFIETFGFTTPTSLDQGEVSRVLTGYMNEGGNDVVDGGDGADIVAGMAGNDVVCGDADDLAVLGGGGTDVPCVTSEETVDASSGSATGDLSSTVRDLDDEHLEVDEDGNHNPYEFVIDAELVSSDGNIDTYKTAKGTVELNRMTGEYTYTADPGATGTENLSFTVRRATVECPDYSATEIGPLHHPDCGPEPALMAFMARTPEIVDVGDTEYLYSLWETLAIFISDPPVDVVPPPAEPPTDPIPDTIVDPVVAVQATDATPAELPRTGSDATDLALAGLALLALGGAATIESRRRLASAN